MPRVPAFAKINLALKVLYRRADGYHQIATLFQTISLADQIDIEATRSPETTIELSSDVEIPGEVNDNLAARAARMLLEEMAESSAVKIRIEKRIPMGGGLGGGSADAAAVLLTLPALLGERVEIGRLAAIGARLGSDVPFFLMGGTCEAHGRGELLEMLPDIEGLHGVLIAPGLHLSTPGAYRDLARPVEAELTRDAREAILERFRALVGSVYRRESPEVWAADCENDFEPVAFAQYAQLESLLGAISATGAQPAMMSGSGSTLFGIYENVEAAAAAETKLKAELSGHATAMRVEKFHTVSRRHYERAWHTALSSITDGASWPPRS